MKISAETLSILSSFSSINPVMYFGDPKAVKVIRSNSGLIGVFETSEQFDKECAFWETPQLLAVINSMGGEKAELDFGDSFVKITNEDGAHVNYMYTPESVIIKNNTKPKAFEAYCKSIDSNFSFELSNENLTKIMKLAKIMGLDTLQFSFKDGEGTIKILDNTSSSVGHTFDMSIKGEGTGEISFDINNLNIINGDYSIIVKNNVFAKWTNKNIPLFYIAGAKKA